jgi:hypothetical protein
MSLMEYPRRCRQTRLPLCWVLLICIDVSLVAFSCAQDQDASNQNKDAQPRPEIVQTVIEGPADVPETDARFEAIDVFLDSGDAPLAAWQLELVSTGTDVQIVGIEGGEHAAFAEPPYYDPLAIRTNRVRIAAFSTGDNLPQGRSRVARIHVQCTGPGHRHWLTELTASATRDGVKIPARLSIAKAEG